MPSTLVGLAIFVTTLAPGLVFVLARQRVAPQQTMSVLRETAQLVCVSLFLDIAVLIAFGIVRIIWPMGTPDVGRLVREPGRYLRESYLLIAWWSLALLAVAVALAALLGSGTARRLLSRLPWPRVRPTVDPHESAVSAWWLLFDEKPGRRVHVGCTLADGTFVSGWLAAFNTALNESGDRDLTLAAPIHFRPPGATAGSALANTSAVVVSASRISLMFVSYQADRAPDPAA